MRRTKKYLEERLEEVEHKYIVACGLGIILLIVSISLVSITLNYQGKFLDCTKGNYLKKDPTTSFNIPEETPIYCADYDNFDHFIMGGLVFTDDEACEPIREDYKYWVNQMAFDSCIAGCSAYQFSRFEWFKQRLNFWAKDKNKYDAMEEIKGLRSDMGYVYSWNVCAEACLDLMLEEDVDNQDTSIIQENNDLLRNNMDELRDFTIEDINFERGMSK